MLRHANVAGGASGTKAAVEFEVAGNTPYRAMPV
jgi:hypothetical protein